MILRPELSSGNCSPSAIVAIDPEYLLGAAVVDRDDDVLRHVDQAAGQVARVRRSIAVSARPLRAPCVERKYSRTVRPSRKFDRIGMSMISPFGSSTSPRMPAIWLIWFMFPFAPESAIMKTEF